MCTPCRVSRCHSRNYNSLYFLCIIYNLQQMNKIKTLALIAHDGKKPEMVAFVKDHKSMLSDINLVATGTTGKYILETGLSVTRKLSGPDGGDAQIAAMAAAGVIDAIIFFRDPLGKYPHEPDIQM